MNRLSLNPRSIVIPSEGALHVLTGRGTGTLKSSSSLRLHEALSPHLNGTHNEEELIAATGSSAAVKTYLAILNQVGALLTEKELEKESCFPEALHSGCKRLEELGPECAEAVVLHDRDAVFVSLVDGRHSLPRCGERCVHFLDADTMGRELLALDQRARSRCTIFYVITPDSLPDLRVRAAYARWLLANCKNLPRAKGSIRIYHLDPEKGTLAFVLAVDFARRDEVKSLPEKLGLVSPIDADQVPLAAATAKCRFFPHVVTKFGMRNDDRLHEELITHFLSLALQADDHDPATFRKTYIHELGSPQHPGSHKGRLLEEDIAWEAAPDHWALRLRLLEKYADVYGNASSAKEVDLLQQEGQYPNIKYLKQVLRVNDGELPARMQTTQEGLCIYEVAFRRHFSFVPAKALQDALLDAARMKLYAAPRPTASVGSLQYNFAEFLTRRQLRNLVAFHEKKMRSGYPPAQLELRLSRCWARSIWAGRIKFL